MATRDIHVPDLGEFHDVLVIDVIAKVGDRVEVEGPLITLETDKATMDVPSPVAGTITAMHVARDARVSTGDRIATVEEAGEGSGDAPGKAEGTDAKDTGGAGNDDQPAEDPAVPGKAKDREQAPPQRKQTERDESKPGPERRVESKAAPEPEPIRATPPPAAPGPAEHVALPPIDEASFANAHASPSVRAFARELGVDLGRVRGTGRKGRITAEDVKTFVKHALTATPAAATGAGLPRVPSVDFAKFGPIEVVPLTRIQRISGPRLHASWVNVPHVTQHEDADVTELEEARRYLKLRAKAEGISLTSLAFVLRACAIALAKFPRVGASLSADGQGLVLKRYCHLGFAADTDDGLVVPVIRDADKKDVFELARALGDLSAKARAGKLSAAEMQGGCFTVSNLGGIGGTSFTPVVNAPEVAVLGVSRAATRPVWKDGGFVPRLMLPLSLSYDHRVVDGADGARFVVFLAETLADLPLLMQKPA